MQKFPAAGGDFFFPLFLFLPFLGSAKRLRPTVVPHKNFSGVHPPKNPPVKNGKKKREKKVEIPKPVYVYHSQR